MGNNFKENMRAALGAALMLFLPIDDSNYVNAEIPPHRIAPIVETALPSDCGLVGEIAATRHFQQRHERHLVAAGIVDTTDESADSNFSQLTVAEFVLTPHGCEERWRFEDETTGFQTSVNFLEKSLDVEDLDDDGSLDLFFIYQFVTDTDAHPIPSFLVMRVGSQVLKASGTSRLNIGPDHVRGGDFEMSDDLRNASQVLQDKARSLWSSHLDDEHPSNQR